MERSRSDLAGGPFDVVVVGGGAFGASAAWEAASRGLSVALLEKEDFCHGTSANHLKVVHGGIRYLQHLDVARVRESCRERSALLRIAPHLVQPLPIVMPTYGRGAGGRAVLGAGMGLYDLITFDRNREIPDPARRIPRGRLLSRDRCLRLFPGIHQEGLTGGGLFHDGQFYNPPRLVWAFLRSAAEAGARVLNYTPVEQFLRDGASVRGVRAYDQLTGERFDVLGRVVLNATGPWASSLLRRELDVRLNPAPSFSRDAGFAVRGRRTGDYALAARVGTRDPDALLSRGGRHVFVMPWRQYTLFGSWHNVHTGDTDDIEVTEEELEEYLAEANGSQPGLGLCREDVSMVYAGLTLFGENDPGGRDLRFGHRSILVDHRKEHGIDGIVTLIGVRATMARAVAQRAIDMVLHKLQVPGAPSRTELTPLHGGTMSCFEDLVHEAMREVGGALDPPVVRALVHNHGTEYGQMLRIAESDERLRGTLGASTTLKAEVIHACRSEMAVTLGDVVFRRTDLGSGGAPGDAALEQCGRLVAQELGWDEGRLADELDRVRSRFPKPAARPA